jgi:hypothetical protein
MRRALLLLLLWPLSVFAQNTWQPTGHFATNAQARLGAIPTPTPGYEHWSDGTYTVALWDAQDLESGNWTDSSNGIVLTKTGNPTYGVYGTEGYSGWKGVTVGSGNYFVKSTGSTALNRGATDHMVIQIVLKADTLSGYESPLSAGSSASFADYYFRYNSNTLTGAWVNDGVNSGGGQTTRGSAVVTGTMYKVRIVEEHGANVSIYENGVLVGTPVTMALIGAFTNLKIAIGAGPTGSWPFLGTIFAVKVDKGTDAAVLLVNDGGPGGG